MLADRYIGRLIISAWDPKAESGARESLVQAFDQFEIGKKGSKVLDSYLKSLSANEINNNNQLDILSRVNKLRNYLNSRGLFQQIDQGYDVPGLPGRDRDKETVTLFENYSGNDKAFAFIVLSVYGASETMTREEENIEGNENRHRVHANKGYLDRIIGKLKGLDLRWLQEMMNRPAFYHNNQLRKKNLHTRFLALDISYLLIQLSAAISEKSGGGTINARTGSLKLGMGLRTNTTLPNNNEFIDRFLDLRRKVERLSSVYEYYENILKLGSSAIG